MTKLTGREVEFYLECIPGVMVIDMNGIVIYISQLCSEYFTNTKEESLGKYVLDVFPFSKMMDNLYSDIPCVVYYHSRIGTGISAQIPLFLHGERVGLLEYDLMQNPQLLYEFPTSYSRFLDRELKNIQYKIINNEKVKYTIDNIKGHSKAIEALKDDIIIVAKTNSTVLITGQTGTGKELVAHAIHNLSDRRNNKMIEINASALPDNLIESELFGYNAGAFTGALKEGKKGKFEQANKSTLFIDEINQLPLSVQPKLLRVLQEREVDPIGCNHSIPIDVRIIAATNQNLNELVSEGKFREDLFYRINVFTVKVPSLKERLDDLPSLIETKIKQLNAIFGKNVNSVEPAVYKMLQGYDWPGNVRELFNMLEKAMNYVEDTELTLRDFDLLFETKCAHGAFENLDIKPIDAVCNQAEKELIVRVIEMCQGNKTKAAKYLRITRTLLYQKMRRLGIKL